MGIRSSKISEEFQISKIQFCNNLNYNSQSETKDSIIFPENKGSETNIIKGNIENMSITEELNKSTKIDFDNKSDLVNFKFEWKNKENDKNKEIEVLLAGTFLNNWETFIKMEKNPETNNYEYNLFLPKEKHFFKFIINNNWQCSDLYPTSQDDSNNTNNYIDLTNYKDDITNKKILNNYNQIKIKREKNKHKTQKLNKRINDGYGLKFPLIKDLNLKAPVVLLHYKKSFLIDNQSIQNKLIFNNNYLNNTKNDYSTENKSYKEIIIFPHEKLGHITSNFDDLFSQKNYFRYSVTERKRHKYITLVYYKPKK